MASEEVAARLVRYGPNLIERRAGDGPLVLLAAKSTDRWVWVLIAAAVAIALGKITDGIVVLAVVLLMNSSTGTMS